MLIRARWLRLCLIGSLAAIGGAFAVLFGKAEDWS